ncbi:late embryogenesis abundant protein At1g64065-like [Diospyros lotus]|uniref:late embryogenesis abundant protein At1g64065-like n=1 Tax=Diospyros lotus TaxID=55363 RepID=UPI002251C0CA|nr:late embryogenesis abundant protein At1g64065-like [Diospyros lotus]
MAEGGEASGFSDEELRRRKRKKLIRYIIAFVIFQTAVIALFSMTVMKFRTPKFRIRSAGFERFEINPSNPSFNFRLNAIVGVKNPNFGTYKFDPSTIVFYYRGVQVGNAAVPNSKANFRSTKNLNVAADLVTPDNVGNKEILSTDLSYGILPLTSEAVMEGEVTIMFFKKKKSARMHCNMDVITQAGIAGMLQNINCE